jgi:hypothetical protein
MLNVLIGYLLKSTFREKNRWSQVSNQTIYFLSNLLFSLLSNAEMKRKGNIMEIYYDTQVNFILIPIFPSFQYFNFTVPACHFLAGLL